MYGLSLRSACARAALLSLLMLSIFPATAQAADADRDGIDDALEWTLANRHAPVVYITPFEWNLPTNVEWFLDRARLRFHHSCSALALCCGDHAIFGYGGASQSSLISQTHSKRGWSLFQGCHHTDPQSSGRDWDDDHHFFLQLQDGDHSGSPNPQDWKVYTHVYPNDSGGINLQYWFFYAYNDGPLNHEGDWENILVELDASHNPIRLYTARHNDPYTDYSFAWLQTTRFGGTHPVVMAATGTHATFESFASCSNEISLIDPTKVEHGCAWGDPYDRWFTWAGGLPAGQPGYQGGGLINVGERDYPLAGQSFLKYSGRWGELGAYNATGLPYHESSSGPRGPAYQDKWNFRRKPSGGSGGSGGYGGPCSEGDTLDPTELEPC